MQLQQLTEAERPQISFVSAKVTLFSCLVDAQCSCSLDPSNVITEQQLQLQLEQLAEDEQLSS